MRWYENNLNLTEILSFIENLSEDDRITVAKHLLQIVIMECNIDLDSEISKISKNDYSYNRWYDNIFDLSSAMEFMKNLPKNKQDYVAKRFVDEIYMSYLKKEF